MDAPVVPLSISAIVVIAVAMYQKSCDKKIQHDELLKLAILVVVTSSTVIYYYEKTGHKVLHEPFHK